MVESRKGAVPPCSHALIGVQPLGFLGLHGMLSRIGREPKRPGGGNRSGS